MNYLIFILSGIFIGLIVAVPIGPVNLLCMRRTLAFGPLNGFVAGVGAAMGDGTFAIVIGFGLTAVRDWIEHHSTAIQLGGGCLLLIFGVYAYIADPLHGRPLEGNGGREPGRSSLLRTMASTFALTITNPATLLAFTALFAGVGGIAAASADAGSFDAAFIVAGVFAGSILWWFTLTTVVGLFHARLDAHVMKIINHVSGVAVVLFGVLVLAHVAWRHLHLHQWLLHHLT
jgi:threonine/homoserine/homoserine lactone efflux protein